MPRSRRGSSDSGDRSRSRFREEGVIDDAAAHYEYSSRIDPRSRSRQNRDDEYRSRSRYSRVDERNDPSHYSKSQDVFERPSSAIGNENPSKKRMMPRTYSGSKYLDVHQTGNTSQRGWSGDGSRIIPEYDGVGERRRSIIYDDPDEYGNPSRNDAAYDRLPESSRITPSAPGIKPVDSYLDQQFQYKQLPQGKYIRLLKLFASTPTSKIKCTLHDYLLDTSPRFVAISYAWGDTTIKSKVIKLDSCKFSVSENLFDALKILRQEILLLKKKSVYVWADAVCINQDSPAEKTHQIQLMTAIYDKAFYVAIWLGLEDDDSSIAMQFLENVAKVADDGHRFRRLLFDPKQQPAIRAVKALFERPYWSRVWVVQEILKAHSRRVYCGSNMVQWNDMRKASQLFSKIDPNFLLAEGVDDWERQVAADKEIRHFGPATFDELGRAIDDRAVNDPMDAFLYALQAFRLKRATDPRDYVFGILGVMSTTIREEFKADYTKNIRKVFTKVVKYILYKTKRVDVICETIHFPIDHRNMTFLPTWVPDWSFPSKEHGFGMGLKNDFNAGRGLEKDFSLTLDNERHHEIIVGGNGQAELRISAVYLDTIAQAGTALESKVDAKDMFLMFFSWSTMFLHEFRFDCTEDMHEAFCKTLLLGKWPSLHDFDRAPQRERIEAFYRAFTIAKEKNSLWPLLNDAIKQFARMNKSNFDDPTLAAIYRTCETVMAGRAFCITKGRLMGLGTGAMRSGDEVVVPVGCKTPMILRSLPESHLYQFVGDVYIDGFMSGEIRNKLSGEELRRQKYVLV
jgi:hypothetical protein